MTLSRYFERKARVKEVKCEYCEMTAQYDFVDDGGDWRYGCTNHWMKHRASRQIGPGHARHLHAGQEPPKRPEGYTPKPIDPTRLAKPQMARSVQMDVSRATPAGGPASRAQTAGERREKRPKLSREFTDMEPQGIDIKEPRPGSVLATTLELMKGNGGATLDEINAAIGPKHDALKLLQWAHENKGYGWKMDPESKKIQVQYYAKAD